MSGQLLSEAIREPVSERVLVRLAVRVERAFTPGTRPRNHEGVIVGQSSARADEGVSARNSPQQTRSSCASVEERNLAHVVPVEGWARFCNVKTLEEWARCADSGSPQEDRSKTVDRCIRREILPRRSPKEAPRKCVHGSVCGEVRVHAHVEPYKGVGAERGDAGVRISRINCLVERATSRRRMPARRSE